MIGLLPKFVKRFLLNSYCTTICLARNYSFFDMLFVQHNHSFHLLASYYTYQIMKIMI